MNTFEYTSAKDISIFGESIVKNVVIDTFGKRLWGAWQVLNGNAGIILLRINVKDIYK